MSDAAGEERARWGRFLPDVNAEDRRLLWLLSAASFFGQYDEQLFSMLPVQIRQDLSPPSRKPTSLYPDQFDIRLPTHCRRSA